MGIRLLSKPEIDRKKAIDRQREIEEGLKLSRKVDALRELQSKEESTLYSYRTQMLQGVQNEIATLEAQKEALQGEIHQAQEFLKKELSKTNRKRLDDLEFRLKRSEKDLEERKLAVDLLEIDAAVAQKQANDALQRATSLEDSAKRMQQEAFQAKTDAVSILDQSKVREKRISDEEKEKREEYELREATLALRENKLDELEAHYQQKDREIEEIKKQLEDQRQTLGRALDRIRKNRL